MKQYKINEGLRNCKVVIGCERGLYNFIVDYSEDLGLTMSGAMRRLILLGARCEAVHGLHAMPGSYVSLFKGVQKETQKALDQQLFPW